MLRGLPSHPSRQYLGISESERSLVTPPAGVTAALLPRGQDRCPFSFSTVPATWLVAPSPPYHCQVEKRYLSSQKWWGFGGHPQRLLRSRSGLLKLIHVSGPTKWRLPQWPSPVTNRKLTSAYNYGKHLSRNPNKHHSQSTPRPDSALAHLPGLKKQGPLAS